MFVWCVCATDRESATATRKSQQQQEIKANIEHNKMYVYMNPV